MRVATSPYRIVKQAIPSILRNRIFQHVLFWVTHLVFYATLYGSFQENYRQTFFEELLYLPVRIIFTYFTLYYLLPRFLLTGKYSEFALWFLGSSFLAGTLQRYFFYNYYYPIYYPQALADPFFYFPKIL